MLLPAITNVTARTTMTSPVLSRNVNVSPKTTIPKKMAVTGSKAPRIAVGADPGKMITDQQETFFAGTIYLGKNDSPENYHEVEQEYAERNGNHASEGD